MLMPYLPSSNSLNLDYSTRSKPTSTGTSILSEEKKRHHQLHEALGRWAVPENINQWRYSIVCNDSAGLEARIFDNDLFCSRHYQNDYARTLPVTQQLSCSIVNFFIAEEYSDAQLLQVIEITKQFLTSE